jgi:asparagine synthase (glutamine-hydrolysing)
MCGILGGVNTQLDEHSVARLVHRGPDQSSFARERVDDAIELTLGQTRLNIVDRHDIDLPVRIGHAAILFNGEIYNHVELRAELEQLGRQFATKTDTEVALAAYLEWGIDCLNRFNGMFALAIWDGERFVCARDRMGKKPLFYRCRGKSFEFASEVKAFPDLQFVAHELFDLFEFCLDEHTLYRDVFALPPASYLTFDPRRGTLSTGTYWDIPHLVDKRITDPDEAVEQFIELLRDAVALRLRADVPVTIFLSGGLDSSIIASLAGVKEAFTCQFAEFAGVIDEERYARDLAERLGIELHMVRPTREEFLHDLPALAYHLEMPTGSFSVFPLYRLAKACHDAGYKVVLSGEGSDELFAGYARNEFLLADARDDRDPKTQNYRSMLARYDGSPLDRFCRMASRSGLAGAATMKGYLTHLWSERKSMCDNICYVESKVFLQPLLQMADRMCMAHSIEGRCPFLDYRLVEFAFALDDGLKYGDARGKWIVFEAARRLLPKDTLLLTREVKHGLPTPVNLWMQGRNSFDRKYWNALMTSECMKTLHGRPGDGAPGQRPTSKPLPGA